MTAIDLQFSQGFPLSPESGVEEELSALCADFAVGWAAVRDELPTATLTPLFVDDGELTAAVISDLQDAARIAGAEPPDLLRWFSIDCPDDLAETALQLVANLPLVGWAGLRSADALAALDDGTVSWGTNPMALECIPLRRSPYGVDALNSWRVDGGIGSDITVADLEYGWSLGHPDLLTAKISHVGAHGLQDAVSLNHGTAVAGIVVGSDNGVGMVGIAPDARMALVAFFSARAIVRAAQAVGPGGVILIETGSRLSTGSPEAPDVPKEVDPAVHQAIRIATLLGVTVVEPAGNGGVDLDNPPSSDYDLGLPSRVDSGAIVVGAGQMTPQGWRPADFPSLLAAPLVPRGTVRGSRVDCFAQGIGVCAPSTREENGYQQFSGTSAASAIIAGVVANIQGMALAAQHGMLAPQDIRTLLRDPRLGTHIEPGYGGIGAMPDLRRLAQSQGWVRALPVAATAATDDAAVLVYLDDNDHLVRRHYSFFTGWGRPLLLVDRSDLFPAQPTVLSWTTAGRLTYLALASGVAANGADNIRRVWWDSDGKESAFEPIADSQSKSIVPGSTAAGVLASEDEMVVIAINGGGQLIALFCAPKDDFLGGPIILDEVAQFRLTTGPSAVSVEAGTVDAVAVADHGVLLWCRGESPFAAGDWLAAVTEPTATPFIPGARLSVVGVGDSLLVAAVGDQGWLHIVEIDPSAGPVAAAYQDPVVVDTAVTLATRGPLALARLAGPALDLVLAFGIDTDGALRMASRQAAGGDWTTMTTIDSPLPLHPAGGVVAITMSDLGVMVFVVDVKGTVRITQSRNATTWTDLAPLPDAQRPRDRWQPSNPDNPSALVSDLFTGDPVLESIAADRDRISRTRNSPGAAVGKVQQALLVWDPTCLPVFGADETYGDETAGAVCRFKRDLLGVPPEQIIDDVGPATVLHLDRIQADHEGLNGAETTLRFTTEYGDPLPRMDFTVTTAAVGSQLHTTDATGNATFCLRESAAVEIDAASALAAAGNLLAREWPPAGGFPAADVLLTPAAPSTARIDPGDTIAIVVATRVTVSAPRVAPLQGSVRIEGPGAAFTTMPDGQFALAVQSVGGTAATAWVDPAPAAGSAPDMPPLVGWTPLGTYTVRPGDSEESLAAAFVGDPEDYEALSGHPPVPGEQLTLPTPPGWLSMASAPVEPAEPALWFTVTPDAIVAAVLAGADDGPLQNLLAVLDRPPTPNSLPSIVLESRAATLLAILTQPGPPIGPDFMPEEDA